MPSERQKTGQAMEALAAEWLERAGMRVVAQNVRTRRGEIDLVAWDGAILCFVEVRFRARSAFGGAVESVGRQKQRRVVRASLEFLARRRLFGTMVRFDVVTVDGDAHRGEPVVRHLRAAFDAGM